MELYGRLTQTDNDTTQRAFHKTQTLTSASLGVSTVQYRSGSTLDQHLTTSGSHYNYLRFNYYASASAYYNKPGNDPTHYDDLGDWLNTDVGGMTKVGMINVNDYNVNPSSSVGSEIDFQYHHYHPHKIHLQKFHESGSIFYIPQKYFGEKIKEGTFELHNLLPGQSKNIIVKDDGYGNIYCTNAFASASVAHASHSDNYIGNIFYEQGVVTITDPGSFSGSKSQGIQYSDMGTGQYHMRFDATHTIFTKEISVRVPAGSHGFTLNPTARDTVTADKSGSVQAMQSDRFAPHLTASEWSPYFTHIWLYSSNPTQPYETLNPDGSLRREPFPPPLIMATLPRAVQKRDDIDIIFKIRIDI